MIGKGYGQREGIPTHETKARVTGPGFSQAEQLDRRPRPPRKRSDSSIASRQ